MDTFFGGRGGTSWSGWALVYSDGVGLPTGRQMYNGSRAAIITALTAGVSGRGAGRTIRIEFGDAKTGDLWVNAGGTAPDLIGWRGVGGWVVQGGSARFHVVTPGNGAIYFSKGGGGQVRNSQGTSWPGTLFGGYQWVEGPTEPRGLVGEAHPRIAGANYIRWSYPASDGGTGITHYEVFRNGQHIANTGAHDFTDTGLTPGQNYAYFIRARNWVSNSVGTSSYNSNQITLEASGPPSAPRSVNASASSTVYDRLDISWAAPASDGYGAITQYEIFADGIRVATTGGGARSISLDKMDRFRQHRIDMRARNQWNNSQSDKSNDSYATPDGPPTAPQSVTGTADQLVPGRITLSWVAPSQTGAGGITGYNVMRSTGERLLRTTGTGTTATLTGLNPGEQYTFYITARNAITQAQNPEASGPASTSVAVRALGEPPAPTGLTATVVPVVAGRLELSWTPPTGVAVTGYSIFRRPASGPDQLLALITGTSYTVDGLDASPQRFFVRSRNSYTDTLQIGYPGNWGGPASNIATGTPTAVAIQAVPSNFTVPNVTNAALVGTYTINAVTASSFSYTKNAENLEQAAVSSSTVANLTNTTLRGTYTITTPTSTTISYTRGGSNIPTASVSGGTVLNTTNQRLSGTYFVPAGGVNATARTITVDSAGSTVSLRSVPLTPPPGGSSTVTNNSNAAYNPDGPVQIIGITETTIQYSRLGVNLPESAASGRILNLSNRDFFNGTYLISEVPQYNKFSYNTGKTQSSGSRFIETPAVNIVQRDESQATLDVEYRSGWIG